MKQHNCWPQNLTLFLNHSHFSQKEIFSETLQMNFLNLKLHKFIEKKPYNFLIFKDVSSLTTNLHQLPQNPTPEN